MKILKFLSHHRLKSNMKNGVGVFLGLCLGSGAWAAPLSIDSTSSLVFGEFAPGISSSGTVIVSPANFRSETGDVTLVGNSYTSATVVISGDVGLTYSVMLAASATLSSASNSMTIDTLTHDAGSSIPVGGVVTFHLGATLHVNINQTPGTYSGNFLISVDYN